LKDRNFKVGVNFKKVAVFGLSFPIAKADEYGGKARDEVIFFGATAEFVAYVADELLVKVGLNVAHAIAENFGDDGEVFEFIGGKSNGFGGWSMGDVFAGESFGFGTTDSIFDHGCISKR